MVGGRSFDDSHFNRVTQARRQAGSAFKPFVYAAALERGYTPASLISALDTPVMTLQGAWVPDDHGDQRRDDHAGGAAGVEQSRGCHRCCRTSASRRPLRAAERLGLGDVPGVPSLALGSGEVTLLSMTAAYAAFANAGMRPTPILIRRVETTEGEVLFTASPRADRAVSEATAFLITNMMADVVNSGTGVAGAPRRLHAAGGGQDRHDQRLPRRLVRRATRRTWRPASGSGYDQPRTIIAQRLRRRPRGAAVGTLHERGHPRRQAGQLQSAAQRDVRDDLPDFREAGDRRVPRRRIGGSQREHRQRAVGVHRVLRSRHRARATTARITYTSPRSPTTIFAVLVAAAGQTGRAGTPPPCRCRSRRQASFPPRDGRCSGKAPSEPPRTEAPRRGFWGRFFRRGDNSATNPPQPAPEPAAMLPATR